MVRLAIYDRQKPGSENETTMRAEIFKKKFENESDISIVGVFIDTCSGMATNEEKPELEKLLEKCQSGDVDIVVTQSISRISRDVTSLLDTVDKFQNMKTALWFENEKIAIEDEENLTYNDVNELIKSYEGHSEASETFSQQNMM